MVGPVFQFPPAPEWCIDSSAQLIRIIDPTGDAIAWLDVMIGSCAGYAVRDTSAAGTTWRQVLVPVPPSRDADHPVVEPRGPRASWRLVERDPASCTLLRHPTINDVERDVSLTASLDDGYLSLSYRLPTASFGSPPVLTLACTTPPLIQPAQPGAGSVAVDELPVREGSATISHDGSFMPAEVRVVSSPNGHSISIVTLELHPGQAQASPGTVRDHVVRIGMRPI